jgi:NAD(P)-dependent dehydrogenase (short-subunit alcohol dehydrogenase family)
VDLTGKVAVVTGSGRGLGLAYATELARRGAAVVVNDVDAAVAEQAVAAIAAAGGNAVAEVVPVGTSEAAQALVDRAVEEFGRLDVLVNNTGINPVYGPLTQLDDGAARKIMDVNVLAALGWTRRALDAGLGEQPGAAVVNIASVAGLAPAPGIAWYGVSKSALIGLPVQLAAELAPRVRVNAVAPAVVRTRFAEALYAADEAGAAAAYPLRRLGEPEDVGAAVAFLACADAGWITGQTLVLDGGGGLKSGL